MNTFLPTFLKRIAIKENQNILLLGCGGGFDFVHSMLLYSELRNMGKSITIGSYSFGPTNKISSEAPVVFNKDLVQVMRVNGQLEADETYAPEIHVCRFLDQEYPNDSPHEIYAYYARSFTVPLLTAFYRQLVRTHNIDCIVLFDGGSDGLMRGDEAGLGDPVEDAVSIATVFELNEVRERILITIGLGADRYNDVSDASSLRAVAELTRDNGFLGSVSLERKNPNLDFYRRCVEFIYKHQMVKSHVAGMVLAAAEGYFSNNELPPQLHRQVGNDHPFFIWPLMAILWGFDVGAVAKRSLLRSWIRSAETTRDAWLSVSTGRRKPTTRIQPVENLPRHEEMRSEARINYTTLDIEGSIVNDLRKLSKDSEINTNEPE